VSENNLVTNVSVRGASMYVGTFAELRAVTQQFGAGAATTIPQLKELAAQTYAVRRGTMLMRTEMRNSMAAMLEGARFMRDIGAIGRNVTSMWTAYTLAQTRVSDAARDVRSAQNDVVIIQDALNRAVRAGDIELQMDLTLKLSKAQSEVAGAQRDVSKAQQDNIIGYAGMAMQMGDIIARLPMMYIHLKMVTDITTADTLVKGANTAAGKVNIVVDAWGADVKAAVALVQARKTAGTAADTLVTGANTVGIWAQVTALEALAIAQLAAIPVWGWAAIAGAAIVGGGLMLAAQPKGGTTANDNSIIIYGGVSVQAEDTEGMIDSIRRRGYGE